METETVTLEVVAPVPKKRAPKPSAGQEVINLAEEIGLPMTPEEHAKLEAAKDDEMVRQFFKANLGDTLDINKTTAKGLFSVRLMEKIKDMPAFLMTTHLQCLTSGQKMLRFAENLHGSAQTEEQKLQALKIWTIGNKDMSIMLERAGKAALLVTPKEEKIKPKNKPPDIRNQTYIGTQVINSAPSGDNPPGEVK